MNTNDLLNNPDFMKLWDENIRESEIKKNKQKRLRLLIIGLPLVILLLFCMTVVFSSLYTDIYREDETMSSFGNTLWKDTYYLKKGNKVYAEYKNYVDIVYTAEAKEPVSIVKTELDGITNIYHIKTQNGTAGIVTFLTKDKEPHFDISTRVETFEKFSISKALSSIKNLGNLTDPQYQYTSAYTFMTLIEADTWYFWALFVLSIATIICIILLITLNFTNSSSKRSSPAVMNCKFGFIFGIFMGMAAKSSPLKASEFWSQGWSIFAYPSGFGSFFIVIIWLLLYISLITLIVSIIKAKVYHPVNLIFYPLSTAASLAFGQMVAFFMLSLVGWIFGQISGLGSAAIEVIIVILFVVGLFSPSSSKRRALGEVRSQSSETSAEKVAREQRMLDKQKAEIDKKLSDAAKHAAEHTYRQKDE